jgi:glycerol-3-phosphate O-acyltransferase
VVGDELEALDGPYDEKSFLKACLARARMYRIEERLISGESASQVMFKSALRLASNRGLLKGDARDARRRAPVAKFVTLRPLIAAIAELAASATISSDDLSGGPRGPPRLRLNGGADGFQTS